MYVKVGDKDAHLYQVIDLETDKVIRGVQEANDETGMYVVLVFNKDGSVATEISPQTGVIYPKTEVKRGKIKIVKKSEEVSNDRGTEKK